MIKLDRMDLSDCFTPEALAEEIYRQCPDLIPPIPIEEIALAAGIEDIRPMATEGVEGMLIADDAKDMGLIFYKEGALIGRQRFTIGHELGHFLLLHHSSEQSCFAKDIRPVSNGQSAKNLEEEANLFSQLVLMPDSLVSIEINRSVPDLNKLKDIAEKFEMSFEAMANKCANLSNIPFALVYSLDGIVRYSWRDRNHFPHRISLKRNDLLPRMSQAVRLCQLDQTISSLEVVDATIWLSHTAGVNHLIEQTYTQTGGYQVTMIKLIP